VRGLVHDGRAVLIGTTHIATSERLSEVLHDRGIDHRVLNARRDAEEAEVIAEAGQPGRVTIATNMAGRGTDIHLHPDVRDNGGLEVISLQMHESPRIDRQLVGRSGRQGDPGSARFVLSLQDPLLLEHAGDERLALRSSTRKFGAPVRTTRALRLWRRVQRDLERRHREMRIALITRQQSLEQLFGYDSE